MTEHVPPHGIVAITLAGNRIGIDLKLHHTEGDKRFWEPVIEGDINDLMPMVIGFDGPRPFGINDVLHMNSPGPGWNTREWAERVMANSRHIFAYYEPGEPHQ